jgi:multicomponent Na+:H+ antiporter subunit D
VSLVALPAALPLLGVGLVLAASGSLAVQRVVSVLVVTATLVASVALLVVVEREGIVTVQLGDWPAPVGITLVADLTAALFLVVSMAVILLVQVFAIGQQADSGLPRVTHPVYLVLAAGVAMSFLAGDLFNLFVAFEVMLIASYVLLTLGSGRAQIRAGMTYVVINILGSTMFLTAVGLIYAATGTVSMADLVDKFVALPEATQTALGVLLLSVFAIKAAVFPFFFWLPDSYPTAPISITAVFAGLLTKVGVYTMIRATTILELDQVTGLLLVVAGVTMVIGGIGAIAQADIKRILSFHIISQVGYMVMGLALYSAAGLAGAVLYVVHQIPVKAVLFLVGGLVEETTGSGALHRLGGMVRRAPVIAVLFILPALSLAGIPPFSGFLAKLALVQAGLTGQQYLVVAAALAAGVFTLFSMSKIWAGVFWGTPDDPVPALVDPDGPPLAARPLMTWATAGMVAVTLVIPAFAGPVWELCERAGEQLLDRQGYATAVFEGSGR